MRALGSWLWLLLMLLPAVVHARTVSLERLERRPLFVGSVTDVDIGLFDEVVSVDPTVVEVVGLGESTVRIRALNTGDGLVLIRRGGFNEDLALQVVEADAPDRYQAGVVPTVGAPVVAGWLGGSAIYDGEQVAGRGRLGASYRQVLRNDGNLYGYVDVESTQAQTSLRQLRLQANTDRYRLWVGDTNLLLGDQRSGLRLRGVDASARFAELGKLDLGAGLVVGASTVRTCCGVFEHDPDLVAVGHGDVYLGPSTTRFYGGMVLSVAQGFLPTLGVEQELDSRHLRARLGVFRVGSGTRASGRANLKLGPTSHDVFLRYVTPGAYLGNGGTSLGIAEVQLATSYRARRGLSLRLDGALGRYDWSQRLRSQARLLLSGQGYKGPLLFGGGVGFLRNWTEDRQDSLLNATLRFGYRDRLHELRFQTLGIFELPLSYRSVSYRGSWAIRATPTWSLGPRAQGSFSGKQGYLDLGGVVSHETRRLRGEVEVGGSLRAGAGGAVGVYATTTGSWRPLTWLELMGGASGRTLGGRTVGSVNAMVRVSGYMRPPLSGGTIRGRVYEDTDLDGRFGPGDRPVPNITVRVGDVVDQTDDRGRYRLGGLPPSQYQMRIETGPSFVLRDGAPSVQTLRLRTAEEDIGLTRLHRVEARIFADDDGDGKRDPGERFLPAELVTLEHAGEEREQAAPEGAATWIVSEPGLAVVKVDPLLVEEGYVPARSAEVSTEVGVRGHQVVWFPMRAQRSVEGKVCVDRNENGRFDPADRCGAGVEVKLSNGRTTFTAPDGRYYLGDLPVGDFDLLCDGCQTRSVRMRARPIALRGVVLLEAPRAQKTVEAQEAVPDLPVAAVRLEAETALKAGERVPYRVFATFEDLSQQRVHGADFRFEPAGIVRRIGSQLVAVKTGRTQLTVAYEGVLAPPTTLVVTSLPIVGMTASPTRMELAAGELQAIEVKAVYIDGDIAPITDEVRWSSDRPDIARVEGNGVVVGVAPGRAVVRGEYLGVRTSPVEVKVSAGASVGKVTISPENLVLGLESRGRMYVDATLTTGRTLQLADDLTWYSDDPSVAQVERGGRIQPIGVGRTTIYARYGDLQTPRAGVEVVPAVGLLAQPTFGAIPVGGQATMRAVEVLEDGSFREQPRAKWRSEDPTIASVEDGVLTANSAGETTVVATHRGQESLPLTVSVVASSVASLELAPGSVEVATNAPGYVDAMATFEDGRTAVVSNAASWVVGDRSIARVDAEGVIEGLRPGRTAVRATWMGVDAPPIPVVVGTAVATVADAVIVEPAKVELSAEGRQELAVSVLSKSGHVLPGKGVRWVVADPSVAWVEDGMVKAVSVGTTTVSAVHGDVRSLPVPVTVRPIVGVSAAPALGRLPVGARVALKAIGVVEDGSLEDLSARGSVRWTSSDADVLRIGEDGTLLAFKPGTAKVTARWRNMATLPMAVEVADVDLSGLSIDPDAASLRVDEALPLAVVASFGDGEVADATPHVTWTTTRPEIAGVEHGLLQGIEPGAAEVYASWMGVESERVRVTVAVANAVGVVVDNITQVLLRGARIPLRTTAITDDGKLLDASRQTTWQVEDEGVVRVDANGYLEAREPGNTSLRAVVGGHASPDLELEVTDATLVRLGIRPGALAVHPGDPVAITARAELSDGREIEVTSQITWEIEGRGVDTDRYNRLLVGHGAKARVRARYGEIRSPWAEIVAID